MGCQVETYSGFRLHERPRRFTLGEAWLEVTEVLAQWYGPDSLSFKVKAGDSRVYILTHNFSRDSWDVTAG